MRRNLSDCALGKPPRLVGEVCHRKRDSIEAHLTIVFAALAVSRWIEHHTGWSIPKFARPPAATAPSRSRPMTTSSPPQVRYPTTSATP